VGADDFHREDRPVHRVAVDLFWIDEWPVLIGEFGQFRT
jgi:formylglycine-generating enzyme required for sulfatase activity